MAKPKVMILSLGVPRQSPSEEVLYISYLCISQVRDHMYMYNPDVAQMSHSQLPGAIPLDGLR